VVTPKPNRTVREHPALQKAAQLLHHEARHSFAILESLSKKRLEVLPHDAMQRAALKVLG
jgi:hypothetical protein